MVVCCMSQWSLDKSRLLRHSVCLGQRQSCQRRQTGAGEGLGGGEVKPSGGS